MKVSILITSYNYGKYIERCLRSCSEQNFPKEEYEVIVIDDCSTDNTEDIIRNLFWVNNLTYIRNKTNLGVSESSNIALKKARGRFVVRVDADDYVSKNYIFLLSLFLEENHDYFCVSCDYTLVSDNEEKIKRMYAKDDPVSCGIMYRKDSLIKLGMYNNKWRHREEEELRKRLGENYKIYNLEYSLYRYRKHKNNKTKQKEYLSTKDDLKNVDTIDLNNFYLNEDTVSDFSNLFEYVVTIIPARGGSKRLHKKNIQNVFGQPMISWAIKASKKSKYVHETFVSSDDDEILKIAENFGSKTIKRPFELGGDRIIKQDVLRHAALTITKEIKKPSLIVSLQANSPEIHSNQIDRAIEKLHKFKRQEIMSVDNELNGNAALRVLTYNAVLQKALSTKFGVIEIDITDIHTIDDIKEIEEKKGRR